MLLVIHNLPFNVKYAEIKALIQAKCGLSDFVLDNLQNEGSNKRVTVGLADEGDAAFLVRKINGLYLNGQQLYVEDVRQTRSSEQPYRPKPQEYSNNYQRDGPRNQPIQDYQDTSNGYQNNSNLSYNSGGGYQDNTKFQEPLMNQGPLMNYNVGSSYYQPPSLMSVSQPTSYLGFADKSQPMGGMSKLSKPHQEHSYGYGGQGRDNRAGSWDDNRPDNSARRMHGKGPEPRWEPPQPVPPPAALRRSPSPPPPPRLRQSWNSGASGARGGQSMASIADYYDPHSAGAGEPQNYNNNPPQRNYRSDFAPAPSNGPQKLFGEHVMGRQERDFPRRQQWNEPKPFQRKGRDGEPRGRGFAGNQAPKPFQRQNRDDGSRPNRNRRDEPKVAPKRFADRRQNDEPPQKKFAPPPPKKFAPPPPRASKYEGDMTKKWRENVPRPEAASKFNNEPITMQKMLNKDETWRGQASSNIAKEIAKKLQLDLSGSVMLRLKRSIRSRINLLLGTNISTDRTDIEARYRAKFPSSGDADFVQAVIIATEEELAANRAKRELENSLTDDPDAPKPEPKKPVVKPKSVKPQPKAKPAQNKTTTPATQPEGKLPSFPNADKKAMQRIKAEERTVKEKIVEDLPPVLQKALEEEVDVLSDLFMSECMDAEKEDEKVICTEIADVVSDEFRKIVSLHMSKRLLNMNANLTVRAISQGKVIHRDLLEAFVKDYGAVALKKSEKGGKLYLIYVNSYDNYDKLCAVGDVIIGGFNVIFKPLHVLGPPPTSKEIREQMLLQNKKFMQSQIDQSKENLLEPGYSITPTVDSVAAEEGQQPDAKEESAEVIDLCEDNTSAEVENAETEEVTVVGESDADQEGEVYDIEGEDDEEHQANGDVQECDVEDVVDCDEEEPAGENVDEDDLEDY